MFTAGLEKKLFFSSFFFFFFFCIFMCWWWFCVGCVNKMCFQYDFIQLKKNKHHNIVRNNIFIERYWFILSLLFSKVLFYTNFFLLFSFFKELGLKKLKKLDLIKIFISNNTSAKKINSYGLYGSILAMACKKIFWNKN